MQSWLHVFRKMTDASRWNSILVKTEMVWFVLWQWAVLLLSILHEHEGLEAGQWESQHDWESVCKVSWNATATLMKLWATSYHLNAFWIEADFVPKMFKWNNLIFVCTHPLKMCFWTRLVWIASKNKPKQAHFWLNLTMQLANTSLFSPFVNYENTWWFF